MSNHLRAAALLTMGLGITVPDAALAYIGPGAGLGAIAITVALLLGVLLLIVGLVWYPVKRLVKGRRGDRTKSAGTDGSE